MIIGVIFLSGCVKTPKAVPNDLEIEYDWGACYADWGWNTLKIKSNGDANLEVTQGFFKEQKQYSFTNEELLEIYGEVVKNNFFVLKEKYDNPNIIDGGCSNLRIKAEEKEHKVSFANEDIKQINRITQKILEILNSKDSDWKTLDKQEICNNARLICETEDSFQGFLCDAWNYTCERIK